MDTFWDSLYPVEQQRLIELLVEVLEIRETGLNLVLKTAGMEDLVNNLAGISCEVKQRS
jgi:site-specific DNA recombinase